MLGLQPEHHRYNDAVLHVRATNPRLQHLTFLYGSYEPQAWWFEVCELLRKVLLTGFIVFFSNGTPTQILCAILITVASLALTTTLAPYVVSSDDVVAVIAQQQLLLTLLVAFVSASGVADADGYGGAIGPVLMVTTVVSLCLMGAGIAGV